MKRRTLVMALTLPSAVPGVAQAASKAESQAEVRKAAQDALAAVYKVAPSARKAVESAAGHAAFSNFGMKILVAGGGGMDIVPEEESVGVIWELLRPIRRVGQPE